MRLIDKFHQWLKTDPFNKRDRPTLREAKCVDIAEDFAVEFGEWLREECYDTGDMWYYQHDNEQYTTKEMLEIFKKEIGL